MSSSFEDVSNKLASADQEAAASLSAPWASLFVLAREARAVGSLEAFSSFLACKTRLFSVTTL
jgi:hypothetical protein